jgi:carbonic anhydrase
MTAIIAPAVLEEYRGAGLSSSVVEQRTCNAQVVSSILTGGSSNPYIEGVIMSNDSFPYSSFEDALAANAEYIKNFKYSELTGVAQKGLAIVTCMDSRINPLSVVGMRSGDAKILRNAGARVTDDVLRTLVLATYLLGVNRILIMPHTNCRMAQVDEAEIHSEIDSKFGVNTSELEFKTVSDQKQALIEDVLSVRSYPLLNKGVSVGGAIYDVTTGKITPVDC